MKKIITLLIIIAWGWNATASHPEDPASSLDEVFASNLKFIAADQKARGDGVYEAGEWPTNLYSTLIPVLVGVGNPFGHDQEATDFTTGSVVNQLGAIYVDHPQFKQIPAMIAKAIPSFKRYRVGDMYNFYPPRMWHGVKVHQPANMTLANIWKGFTNVPQDADTSSIVYSALYYDSVIHHKHFAVPEKAKESFARYRDVARRPYFYNKGEDQADTGAFLTWQFNENSKQMPHFWFAAPQKGVRIPFNRNDVDCVVNLNVLRMLALTHNSNIPGHDESCSALNTMAEKDQQYVCGIYYPNTFNMAYSSANLQHAGDSCMASNNKKMVEFILASQTADGGWYNDENVWKDDRIQSTAFALNALAVMGDFSDIRVQDSMKYGVSFLLRNMSKSKDGHLYWKGEVFFTAIAIARSLVVWKSDSYTTAVAMAAIVKAQTLMPEYTYDYYMHLN